MNETHNETIEEENTQTDIVDVPQGNTVSLQVVAGSPDKVLESASQVAMALKPLIQNNTMTVNINGKQYPKVEVWLTLAMMHGVTTRTVWTKRMTDAHEDFMGYEACTEVVRLSDGMVIGKAEASVTNDEPNWRNKDEYALKSMAQTRSTAQALRRIFAYIVTLTGIETTSAEEMDFAVNTDSTKTPAKKTAGRVTKTQKAQAVQSAGEMCKKCGQILVHDQRGNYSGWFCPDAPRGDKTHSVIWDKK